MVKISRAKLYEIEAIDKAVERRIVDHGRWSVRYSIVFEYNGKFYRTEYSVGATETQDEEPWMYQNEVECVEVELKEVLKKEWLPVE